MCVNFFALFLIRRARSLCACGFADDAKFFPSPPTRDEPARFRAPKYFLFFWRDDRRGALDDVVDIPQTAESLRCPARGPTSFRSDGSATPRARAYFDVVLRRRVLPHLPIHRGSEEHRRERGERDLRRWDCSARPCASSAMMFAVAGATSRRFARSARSMCVGFQSCWLSKTLVITGFRESVWKSERGDELLRAVRRWQHAPRSRACRACSRDRPPCKPRSSQ